MGYKANLISTIVDLVFFKYCCVLAAIKPI